MKGRADDAGPNEPVYLPSKLVEDVLGTLERAGVPETTCAKVQALIEEWETDQDGPEPDMGPVPDDVI